jgi:hypothetical protein
MRNKLFFKKRLTQKNNGIVCKNGDFGRFISLESQKKSNRIFCFIRKKFIFEQHQNKKNDNYVQASAAYT